ncbi:MAG: hypothetical protein JO048_11300 [Methylobacteriaceae bacterium]|nr:hypothetical protein [Methylobacteriaceae bacterium]
MTVIAYGNGPTASRLAVQSFDRLRTQLNGFQSQLSTGKVATTVAGLGIQGSVSLGLGSTASRLEAYQGNAQDASLRSQLIGTGLQQLDALGSKLASGLTDTVNLPIGRKYVVDTARGSFEQAVDILNSSLGDRYLFSGRATDTRPVLDSDLLLNGDAQRAGVKTLIDERTQADLGTAGLGRLTLASAGTTTTVSEEAYGLPFGVKIAGIAATGAGLAATFTAGAAGSAGPPAVPATPASAAIDVTGTPVDGDAVTYTFTLPDGTTGTLTLSAGAAPADGADGAFAIGATPAATSANLTAALQTALQTFVTNTVPGASAAKAADDFFAARPGAPPPRVDTSGGSAAAATAIVSGTAANTVIWYQGDDGPPSAARGTNPARLGDNQTIGIGAQANEAPFRALLAGFAVLAVQDPAPATPPPDDQTLALLDRARTRLTGQTSGTAVRDLAGEFSLAKGTADAAAQQLSQAIKHVGDSQAAIENADPTEAASKLIQTQTRLQAAYQTTSTILRLSLVDYL